MELYGDISYSSQDPWLFPSTIRQNILFGEHYDKTIYDEVVRVCALEYDFSLFDDGDLTVVTDRGMNLSKGQQARINLARTVYRNRNIYLLDDPLTALDNHVRDFIFEECILKYLKDKICILVSHQPSHIKKAENVFVLNEGRVVSYGTPKSIAESTLNKFVINAKDSQPRHSEAVSEKKVLLGGTEQQQEKRNVYREVKKEGSVDLRIFNKYFQFGGGFIIFFSIIGIYIGSQFVESYADKLLSKWQA